MELKAVTDTVIIIRENAIRLMVIQAIANGKDSVIEMYGWLKQLLKVEANKAKGQT